MDNPIQQKRLENTLLIAKSFGLESNNIEKSPEVFTEDSLLSFAQDLQKGLDDGSIDNDYFEKAVKDLTKLQKKIITNSQGHQQTVYVRVHDDGAEHHFKHEDKVKFTHGGKEVVGHIKGLKSHDKYDKFGTAEIHDKDGNKYSKSLRQIEHHHVPEEDTSTDYKVDDKVIVDGTKNGTIVRTGGTDMYIVKMDSGDEYGIVTRRLTKPTENKSKAVVSTDKPIGHTISEIGSGGKEHNVRTVEPEKPKLSGVEAINTKQKQLKAIQEQIKNHDTGVKKLQSGELHNLKEKAKLIQTIINKLSDKVDSREGKEPKK